MPKLVSELAQGNQFGRSSDGGNLADTAVRVWKVILNSANEPLDIFAAIGVQIGDPYSSSNQVPCVSVEGRADGESRLVRIITATYKTTAGDSGGGEDPKLVMPELRPANFSTSTSLYEAPAYLWKRAGQVGWEPAANPCGDIMDGVSRMDAITTIRVTQFNPFPGTIYSAYCGYINTETMTLGAYMQCEPHTVMFRGVEATPHVETFGTVAYRGFMNSYEFAYKANDVEAPGYSGKYGWDLAMPVTGFNCKAFNPIQAGNDKDEFALPLKKDDSGRLVKPFELQDGVNVGDKVRALVWVSGFAGIASQSQSAQPIPLNEDGTPRSPNATPKVLIWRVQTQLDIDLTQTLNLRLV
jgi:hypothetical protein